MVENRAQLKIDKTKTKKISVSKEFKAVWSAQSEHHAEAGNSTHNEDKIPYLGLECHSCKRHFINGKMPGEIAKS